MVSVVVVGTQWGDEGKGKIIDFLSAQTSMVVRCTGGSNAGHTVCCNGNTYKLHLVPSGILYDGVDCIIANGTVVDLKALLIEIDTLTSQGFSVDRLKLSDRAQLIMPYHIQLDGMQELAKGAGKIGTTGRGIGPCYEDKVSRCGIRVHHLLNWHSFEKKVRANTAEKNKLFTMNGLPKLDAEAIIEEFRVYAERIKPFIADTSLLVNEALDAGKRVLFEGAQGTLLDIDLGTYPYVTSSSPIAGGVCTGAGVGPTKINRVAGIAKSYTTRVGDGPFPSELLDEMGDKLRIAGHEFGTTTGRPRRCGWFDVPVVKYSVLVNGLSDIVLTKLDILDGFPEIKICVAYEYEGKILPSMPADLHILTDLKPIFETLPGWMCDTSACRQYDELPENAKKYVERLEKLCGAPISIVAIGSDRKQTIIRKDLFA